MDEDRKAPRKSTDSSHEMPVPTRDEWEDTLATFSSHFKQPARADERQRARDRAGDEPPPRGTGRPRK